MEKVTLDECGDALDSTCKRKMERRSRVCCHNLARLVGNFYCRRQTRPHNKAHVTDKNMCRGGGAHKSALWENGKSILTISIHRTAVSLNETACDSLCLAILHHLLPLPFAFLFLEGAWGPWGQFDTAQVLDTFVSDPIAPRNFDARQRRQGAQVLDSSVGDPIAVRNVDAR